ncbi:MAG: cadmium-translocating P-type ATPase [Firmicutes bacterium]|nr:cadmium-translocating P-type ATPase [Bacillota bacterium]
MTLKTRIAGIHSFDPALALRLLGASLIFALAVLLKLPPAGRVICAAVASLIAGYDMLLSAAESLMRKHILDEHFLMTVAVAAAFAISQYYEGAAVVILFQVGELFQGYAVGRSRDSVTALMELRPDTVTLLLDEQERSVPAGEAKVGDIVLIRPGERVAVDCSVIYGNSELDNSALTGESLPVAVAPESRLCSGAMNLTGSLQAVVTASAEESTAARIIQLVQAESAQKGQTERLITRFARIYTPVVVALAILIAIFLPLLGSIGFRDAVAKACNFLVVACPCALVISVPLAFFAGIGGAARKGILFKSSGAMDMLIKAKAVVFDKTGTLTTGRFRVSTVKPIRADANLLLKITAHAEAFSNHPVAKAIVSTYGGPLDLSIVQNFREHPGMGVTVLLDGAKVAAGNRAFIEKFGIMAPYEGEADLAVYVVAEGRYAGCILLMDTIKEDAIEAVSVLSTEQPRLVAMVSGDGRGITGRLAQTLGIGEYYAECMPEDKVRHIQEIKKRVGERGSVVFVGDGINDAPVLAAADVGVAMGGFGSDAAVEAADIVLMDDSPLKLMTAIQYADNTRAIVLQNAILALGCKLLILALSAVTALPLWIAVFADVGVALLCIVNAMRAFRLRPSLQVPPEETLDSEEFAG